MKLFLIFIFITSHTLAQTWIELAKTADFHQEHPGKKFAEVEPGSPRLEFLEKQRGTIEKIISGEPAHLPSTFPEPAWLTQFMMAHLDLSSLMEFHAAQQEWEKVFALLELAEKNKSTILASEPTLLWALISSAGANPSYDSVRHIAQIKDPIKKRTTLRKLRRHWLKLRASPADFLSTQKGETKFATKVSTDFKGYLKTICLNLDSPPITWDSEFAYQLTTRELLKLPFDPKTSRQETLADLEKQFIAIRNAAPRKVRGDAKPPVNPLAFYREHPNGLWELCKLGFTESSLSEMADRRATINLIHETAWKWLLAEADDHLIDRPQDIIDLLSTAQQKEFVNREIKIEFEKDLISAQSSDFLGMEFKTEVRVHDIFLN